MRSLLGLLALGAGLTVSVSALAADYAVPTARAVRHVTRVPYIDRGPNPYCGPRCGCPIVVHVRHRTLERAYSYAFDPRTKSDDPHYFYGPVRTYARYVDPARPDLVYQY